LGYSDSLDLGSGELEVRRGVEGMKVKVEIRGHGTGRLDEMSHEDSEIGNR
jgi:hypothetical protein